LALLATAAIVVVAPSAAAQQPPGPASAGDRAEARAESDLARRHVPVIMLKAPDHDCDTNGEPFAPMAVDTVLGNRQVALRQYGNGDPTVLRAPTAGDLHGLGEGFYLDFPGDALHPGCLYERDFDRSGAAATPTVYAHVARQPDEPGRIGLQYWLYWYFNDWNNKHESDWEFVQLTFPVGSAIEALASEPDAVGYAQHEGGERADWSSDKLERDGDRPIVYSSARSHASYFGAALYLGRSSGEGFGCDNTDGPSRRVDPDVVVLPDAVDDPAGSLAWLGFAGRWGERHRAPNDGPSGPATKARWSAPFDWERGLRDHAFVVPTGDSQATQLVAAFCGAVEYGSVKFLQFQSSPTQLTLAVIGLSAALAFIVRRTSWREVAPEPVVRRRRAGEIARVSTKLYRRHLRTFAALGLLSLPVAAIGGLVGSLVVHVPILGELVTLADTRSRAARLAASVLIGGLANVVAFVIVSAAVAEAAGALGRGGSEPLLPLGIVDRLRGRARPLASGFVRALVLVALLYASVVGIPLALGLIVRFQFLPQVVMLEGGDGPAGLRRSWSLVRGRWWHTAVFTGAVNAIVNGAGFVIGLVLLVAFPSLPLWALPVFVTVSNVAVMPLGAIAMTLLYGDAAAEAGERADQAAMDALTPE
jgi:hypothetical protein